MKVTCPVCRSLLPASQLNVAADVAVCAQCNEAFTISGALASGQAVEDLRDFDLRQPPRGASFEETVLGWRLRATTRSPAAFFLVPFMCVWSGISLGGIYGSQIVAGEFKVAESLFGIPFLLGTLFFGSFALMSVCGQVVVAVECNEGRVFTGVGPVGWTRRFDWPSITAVEEDYLNYQQAGSNGLVIALIGQSRLKFGSMLTDSRRYYLLQALRSLLAMRQK